MSTSEHFYTEIKQDKIRVSLKKVKLKEKSDNKSQIPGNQNKLKNT